MAVALVAVAAKQLVSKTATDKLTTLVVLVSAVFSFAFQLSWVFPVLIIGGGLATLLYNTLSRKDMLPVRTASCSVEFCLYCLKVVGIAERVPNELREFVKRACSTCASTETFLLLAC